MDLEIFKQRYVKVYYGRSVMTLNPSASLLPATSIMSVFRISFRS